MLRLVERRLSHPEDSVVSREDLINAPGLPAEESRARYASDHALNQGMSQLRLKLAEVGSEVEYIKTREARGYELIHPVSVIESGGDSPVSSTIGQPALSPSFDGALPRIAAVVGVLLIAVALFWWLTVTWQQDAVEAVLEQRMTLQDPLVGYNRSTDLLAVAIIRGKTAISTAEKEEALAAFKKAAQDLSGLAALEQHLARAAPALRSVEHLGSYSEARDDLVQAILSYQQSVDAMEDTLRAAARTVAKVPDNDGAAFGTNLTRAVALKREALEYLDQADSAFGSAYTDWPTVHE